MAAILMTLSLRQNPADWPIPQRSQPAPVPVSIGEQCTARSSETTRSLASMLSLLAQSAAMKL